MSLQLHSAEAPEGPRAAGGLPRSAESPFSARLVGHTQDRRAPRSLRSAEECSEEGSPGASARRRGLLPLSIH